MKIFYFYYYFFGGLKRVSHEKHVMEAKSDFFFFLISLCFCQVRQTSAYTTHFVVEVDETKSTLSNTTKADRNGKASRTIREEYLTKMTLNFRHSFDIL